MLRQATLEFSVGLGRGRVRPQVVTKQERILLIGSPLHTHVGMGAALTRRREENQRGFSISVTPSAFPAWEQRTRAMTVSIGIDRSQAQHDVCFPDEADKATALQSLRTSPLPVTHVPVGDCWQNSR